MKNSLHLPQGSTRTKSSKGFTLIELIVSMTITLLIVGSLIAVTSTALTTFRESTDSLRGYRQAKSALDQIALDLESVVIRKGNDFEWLNAQSEKITNTDSAIEGYITNLIFLTSATDRYNGDVTQAGDVSCVRYGIEFANPINGNSATGKTFVLYRKLYNPGPSNPPVTGEQDAFTDFLNQTDLSGAVNATPALALPANFICENIREMTIVFNILYTDSAGADKILKVPVLDTGVSDKVTNFSLTGNGITTFPVNSGITGGRIVSIDINIQIVSDGVVALNGSSATQKVEENTQRYTKTVLIPQL